MDVVDRLCRERNVAALVALLDSDAMRGKVETRGLAARALGDLKAKEAVDPVGRLLREDTSEAVRSWSAIALGEIGDRSATEPLVGALSDQHSAVRIHAAKSLGKLEDPESVAALIQALNDPVARVRMATAEALGRIRDREALVPLRRLAAKDRIFVRHAATEAIERIERGNSSPEVFGALRPSISGRARQLVRLTLGQRRR